MNGITNQLLSLKDKIDQSKNNSKKEKVLFIASILISNAFVFLLTNTNNIEKQTAKENYIKHSGYQTIVISAENLTDPEMKDNDNYISVINENNEIVIKDAYFINKENSKFKIEISDQELKKAPSLSSDKLIIVPHINIDKKVINNKKENKYEVEF